MALSRKASLGLFALLLLAAVPGLRAADCNGNQVPDATDIANGTSKDCNKNSIPDQCDVSILEIDFAPTKRYQVSNEDETPTWLVIGDFDLDGDPDLVVSNRGDSSDTLTDVSLLLNTGGGVLGPPTRVLQARFPLGLVSGDIEGDGDLDLAVAGLWPTAGQPRGAVALLSNRGEGTFEDPNYITFPAWPAAMAASDLDRDGDLDFALVSRWPDQATVLLNRGNGEFSSQSYPTGEYPSSIIAVDLNGDGSVDLLVTNGREYYSMLMNQGDGTFEDEKRFTSILAAIPPAAGDLDGDGDIDLVINDKLHFNRGTAEFDDPVELDSSFQSFSPLLADIDGEGSLDIVTAAPMNRFALFLNEGKGTFRPRLEFDLPVSAYNFQAADLNGDGQKDLVALSPGCGELIISFNIGKRSPRAVDVNRNGVPDSCEPDCDHNGFPDDHDIATETSGDCNRNGMPDSCDVRARLGFSDPDCYVERQGFTAGESVVADLDGDSFPDLAFLAQESIDVNPAPNIFESHSKIVILFNSGRGTFETLLEIELEDPPYALMAADLDGDRDIDLATSSDLRERLTILRNDGGGSFSDQEFVPVERFAGLIGAVDLDQDGDADLITLFGTNDDLKVSILFNNGDGTFADAVEFPKGRYSGYVEKIADLNGDGYPDLLARDNTITARGNVTLLLNDGGQGFLPPRKLFAGFLIAVADLDGDGDLDLVANKGRCNEKTILLNDGNGVFKESAGFSGRNTWLYAFPFDLDGDGDLDLVTGGLPMEVLLNDGHGSFSPPIPFPSRFAGKSADLDRDGKPDFVAFGGYGCPDHLVAVIRNATAPPWSQDRDRNGIPDECLPAGRQVPGDANQDGKLGISDPAWLLIHFFGGARTRLPCEGGSAANPGPGELALLDVTGDRKIDISDAVALLFYLFLPGNPPPVLGTRCAPLTGCPDICR